MASIIGYKIVDSEIMGCPPVAQVDATAKIPVGSILVGVDPTYGAGEFMYVKYTGTVAAGDFVLYDRGALTCVQAATGGVKGDVGIAMAAATTGQYGYIMVRGIHDAANVATGQAAGVALGLSATPGRATATSAGNKIDGSFERLVTSAANVGTVELAWPAWTGNG